ncbi:MAG: GreA/GreB family elongation factor [Bdellovibrionaceae bacterium]|nr:GreA/GreB family elongation factor [Pseudobdellovibrionaceae bacterium]
MKTEKPKLVLCQKDFDQIMSLMSVNATEAMELLEEEISDAQVIEGDASPENRVGLNTTVEILDLDKDTKSSFQLVLPKDANADEGMVSILTPMGMAVIGLAVGQEYKWPMPNGNIKNFKILSVK